MAGSRHTMRADARANFDANRAGSDAIALMEVINRLAKHLATLMQEAHGGDWRVQIEHDAGLLVVARRLDDRVHLSSLREAV